MTTRMVLLSVVAVFVLFGILFFIDYSKETKEKYIDPNKYEKVEVGFISKDVCGDDNQCKSRFNEDWDCIKENGLDKCICIISEENNHVCGVDGKTYRNPSESNCLGVEIDYEGECKKENIFCQKCGNECITNPRLTDRECNEPTEDFECKIINGECKKIQTVEKEFKTCKNNQEFKCLPITQGIQNLNPPIPPIVCGCMPTQCHSGQFLVVNGASGIWPDGTQKGTGGCSSQMPP